MEAGPLGDILSFENDSALGFRVSKPNTTVIHSLDLKAQDLSPQKFRVDIRQGATHLDSTFHSFQDVDPRSARIGSSMLLNRQCWPSSGPPSYPLS